MIYIYIYIYINNGNCQYLWRRNVDNIKSLLVQYKIKVLGRVMFNVKHVSCKVKFVLLR